MKYIMIITIHADPAMAPGYEEWGGTHVYMKELIDGFAARKIRCVMFTRKSMAFKDFEQYNEYCMVIRLSNGDASPIDKTLLWHYHEENLAQIQAFINEHGKPDIIHSVYWNSGRLAMELGHKNSIPFVHSVISNSLGRASRGAIELVPKRAEYEREIYEKAKWIICVSEDERNDIVQFYNILPEKVMVAGQHIHEAFLLPSHDVNGFPRLYSDISTEEREKIAAKLNTSNSIQTDEQFWNRKVFTYMGRVGFNKGLEQIIHAWHRLCKRYEKTCPPLWIAGGSVAEIHHIREAVRRDTPGFDFDMHERNRLIVWWGYLDAAGLSTLLLKTLALIMHSYYEPGGRVIVEAMSEGVPVIATPYGFGKDYIVNWRNGFLVEHGDINTLYLRMAHFLHQPYLSDALGRNARQDAKTIIKSWNFVDSHLMAYGLKSVKVETVTDEKPESDYFKARKVNLFPYINLPLSENYIKEFVSRVTGRPVLECTADKNVAATSNIYRVKTEGEGIIVKQAFTRLRTGPMFNPFDRERYVKKAHKSFRVELSAYKRLGATLFTGYDDTHNLFAFKELKPVTNIDTVLLHQCVDFIVNKADTATSEEKLLFNQILSAGKNNEIDIGLTYGRLEQELPDYYFERSGCFSETIGWASAPFILDFNRDSFQPAILHELQVICEYFYANARNDDVKKLKSINTDVKFKHFMLDGEQLEMIDLEKISIGSVESELAGLLYDYWHTVDGSLFPSKLLNFLPNEADKRKILSCMAHICFYDIQVFAVMHRVLPIELERLRMIYHASKELITLPP